MSKMEFMSELESLLQDISPEEREAALTYYEDYFKDAGSENEELIMNELGTPTRIAAIIKHDIEGANEGNQEGEFTETGYKDANDEVDKFPVSKEVVHETKQENQQSNKNSHYENKSTNTNDANRRQSNAILIVILCIFGLPIILPLAFGLFGVAIGIVASIFGIFIAFAVTAVALVGIGVVLLGIGFSQLFVSPAAGMVIIGTGLILLGIGAMLGVFGIWLCIKVLPAFISWIIQLCKSPFRKNKEVVL